MIDENSGKMRYPAFIFILLKGLIGLYNDFCGLSNSSFIQYCDSNIGLFSLASYKAIALPTIATAIVVALKGDSEE